jgi:hypothetical protein
MQGLVRLMHTVTVFTLKLMGQFLTTSPVQVVAVVWRIMLGRMLDD